MQYTGGTTGPSKGAVLTNRNITHQISQWVTWTDSKIGEEVGVSAFPLFHLAGLLYAYVGLSIGMTQVLIPNPRDVAFIVNQVKKYRPTSCGQRPHPLHGDDEERGLPEDGPLLRQVLRQRCSALPGRADQAVL